MTNDTLPRRGHTVQDLEKKARFIRLETVRLGKVSGAGHYSAVFSCAELFAALYYSELRVDPQQPQDPNRDRFVLSKGHAAIGLYPVLADLGFFDSHLLDSFTRMGSAFGDHPDMKKIPGVDFSSGSLGHGLSIGVGMALATRLAGLSANVWVMVGDGELGEGQIWEAAMAASQYRLGRLRLIIDANQLQIDGFTKDVMNAEPIHERFAAFGWDVQRIAGHDIPSILKSFNGLLSSDEGRPQCIVADTVKGKGVARMELSPDWHVGNLVGQDYDDVIVELGGCVNTENGEG